MHKLCVETGKRTRRYTPLRRCYLEYEYVLSSQSMSLSGRSMFGRQETGIFVSFFFLSREIRTVAAFRMSAHKLHIETGRHTRPTTPREGRLCTRCNARCVEDEMHLFECARYEAVRQKHGLVSCVR